MTLARLRGSLRAQLWLIIALLLTVSVATAAFTLYSLNLRKHDYLILNLTGQLRVNQRAMVDQAVHYLAQSPDDYAKYGRDLGLYWQDLQKQLALAEAVVTSLRERRIDPQLSGRDGEIQCTWDDRSRSQMEHTAVDWGNFRSGIDVAIGPRHDEPRLEYVAKYIVANGEGMADSADRLANAFQSMMESKLNDIRTFQLAAGALLILLLGVIAVAADIRVLRPLQRTVEGFKRVARGELGHQIPALGNDELGRMTHSFNALSSRLDALFRLTDRINHGTHLAEMLELTLEEFRRFVRVDWLAVLFIDESRAAARLERMAGRPFSMLHEGESFPVSGDILGNVIGEGRARAIDELQSFDPQTVSSGLARRLAEAGLRSALLLPIAGERGVFGVLVCAAEEPAVYDRDQTEFFGNIAGQVGHILEKTVVTEGLVVAAVEGLAKLAESRDPETGDHLLRMARYSAIVAEEMGRDGPHKERISPAYVRDVLRFAPMHDIGKVGIADSILLKPARLDPDERHEMERHPAIGALALRRCEAQMNALGRSIFHIGIEIAECHHEKFDGSGYPAGLVGEAIPLSARIVAVADVFDALTSKRPYKEAWPVDKALAMLDEAAGLHFDPAVVAAFHRALPRVMEVYEQHKHV